MRCPLLYVYQTLCNYFLLLSVIVNIMTMHVSYKLFRWLINIFNLKVCAVIANEVRNGANRFLTYVFCQKVE